MNKKRKLNFKIIKIITIVIFIILALRLIHLQIILGDEYLEKAEKNILRRSFIKASRGIIYDRNGNILVNNRPSFLLTITPSELKNKEKTFSILEKLICLSQKEIEEKILYSPYPIYTPVEIKHDLSLQTVAEISELLPDLSGISIEAEPIRNYPNNNLASHILGYVGLITEEEMEEGKDQNYQPWEVTGKDGIELYYNSYLRGKQGIKEMEVNSEGKIVEVLGETVPLSGNNIYLTIDTEFQEICEHSLEVMLKKMAGENTLPGGGAVVVLCPKTGEVLAMCSKPDFNPNLFSTGISQKDYKELTSNPWHPMFNRCIAGLYPPASTFKMVTGTAALEEGLVSSWTEFYCAGFVEVEEHIFNCDLRSGHKQIDFIHSISKSCDVVFYELGLRLGLEKLRHYAEKFNLGIPTGIDLPGESGGLLPGKEWKKETIGENWYSGDTVNLSIGQGYMLATPLQMALATSVIANQGYFYPPHTVQKIISETGETVYEYKAEKRSIDVLISNMEAIRKGMEMAVSEGTAKEAVLPGIKIAGKTGTAENLPTPENPEGKNHGWFVAFAPVENPELVIVVFLEQTGDYAGKTAVPLGREIIGAYFELKKIGETERVSEHGQVHKKP